MQVSEIMTENPVMIDKNSSIADAAKKMRDEDCGVLPVGDLQNLEGMITDRDITIWAVAEELNLQQSTVADIMSTEIITCHAADDLGKAADIMSLNGVRRLVVKDDNQEVVGIVSISDLMKNIGDENVTDDVMHHVLKYA